MKMIAIIIGSVFGILILTAVVLHAFPIASDHGHLPHFGSLHGDVHSEEETVTVQLNNHSNMVCGTPFFDSTYAFMQESFADGVDKVNVSEFEENAYNLIRNSDSFPGNKEPFLEQIKNTAIQIVDIVKEDPSMLDSCENFRIAMFGPL